MEPLMTSDEVAALLKVDVVTIRRLVNRGELSAYRVGSEFRFTQDDLTDYLQRQRVVAAEDAGEAGDMPRDQFAEWAEWARKMFTSRPTRNLDRFDKFTERARNVLNLAHEEAIRLKHNYIGTEHLLLGLIKEREGIAGRVLSSLGVDLEQVRSRVEAITGKGDRVTPSKGGLTPRAKKVIELAVDEARHMYHHYIGTEHLLLGMLREGEGIGVKILQGMGLTREQIGKQTLEIIRQTQGYPDEESVAEPSYGPVPEQASALLAEGEEGLTCERCGARSPSYFQYCFNCGQRLPRKSD
jgi:excisionase family DNA binding protein